MNLPRQKAEAVERARSWVAAAALILDTETTGLDGTAEACQIAIVDLSGALVLNELIRTVRPIPESVTALHHIAEADVAGAPRMREVLPRLEQAVAGRKVITYNLDFDARILRQTIDAGAPGEALALDGDCAMRLYSLYRGEWNSFRGNWRWFKLSEACGLEGIPIEDVTLHDARGDCELTRRLILKLAQG